MNTYPWEEIQAKYETGKHSIADLSEEYGFNERYGYKKANKEGWVKGLRSPEIHEAAAKRVDEKEISKEAYLRERYNEIFAMIREETYEELFGGNVTTDFDRLKQLKISTQIMSNCRTEQWETNMFEKAADKMNVDFSGEMEHSGGLDLDHGAADNIIRAIETNREREGDDKEGSE